MPHEAYGLDTFRAGREPLMLEELAEIGDVRGGALLHLQCHLGQDTWRGRAAVPRSPVSTSPRDIAGARALAAELDLPATFVRSLVGDLPDHLTGQFDVV